MLPTIYDAHREAEPLQPRLDLAWFRVRSLGRRRARSCERRPRHRRAARSTACRSPSKTISTWTACRPPPAAPRSAYSPGRQRHGGPDPGDAGAILIGKTNMDQFATGLVGTRSPYGACSSVFDARYISGGSSSGSAVAVARVWSAFRSAPTPPAPGAFPPPSTISSA